MKDIKLEEIKKYNESYDGNFKRRLMENVLKSTAIDVSVRISDKAKDTLHNFEVDIDTMSAPHQYSSGRCWIFAGTNVLREIVKKKCNLDNFELSQSYISFFDRFEKANYLLEAVIELKDVCHDDRTLARLLEIGVQDGGQWDMFVNVVKKYGVCPKSVYNETFQSNNTRQMNSVINVLIRRFAAFASRNKDNIELIRKEKEKVIASIYEFMCTCLGKPVEKFDFEYVTKDKKYNLVQDLTPIEFYDKYVGCDLDEYVSIINAPTKDKPYYKVFTVKYLGNVVGGKDIKYLNLPIEEFKELCVKQLKDGQITWFGCDCGKYGSRQDGIWDNESYDYLGAFDFDLKVSKEDMLDYYVSSMDHAMVLTGVSFKNGKVTKWKIENSWGTDHANKGYYLMSDSWFDNFVYQAVINKKYLSEEQKAALDKDLIKLEPWDPMGTLAD